MVEVGQCHVAEFGKRACRLDGGSGGSEFVERCVRDGELLRHLLVLGVHLCDHLVLHADRLERGPRDSVFALVVRNELSVEIRPRSLRTGPHAHCQQTVSTAPARTGRNRVGRRNGSPGSCSCLPFEQPRAAVGGEVATSRGLSEAVRLRGSKAEAVRDVIRRRYVRVMGDDPLSAGEASDGPARPEWLPERIFPFQSRHVAVDGANVHYVGGG